MIYDVSFHDVLLGHHMAKHVKRRMSILPITRLRDNLSDYCADVRLRYVLGLVELEDIAIGLKRGCYVERFNKNVYVVADIVRGNVSYQSFLKKMEIGWAYGYASSFD